MNKHTFWTIVFILTIVLIGFSCLATAGDHMTKPTPSQVEGTVLVERLNESSALVTVTVDNTPEELYVTVEYIGDNEDVEEELQLLIIEAIATLKEYHAGQ